MNQQIRPRQAVKKGFFLLLISCFSFNVSLANQVIILKDTLAEYLLEKHLEWYKDSTATLDISAIRNIKFNAYTVLNKVESIPFLSNSHHWVKFSVENPFSHKELKYLLHIGMQEALKAYIFHRENKILDTILHGGIFLPTIQSSFPSSKDFLPIKIPACTVVDVYIELSFIERYRPISNPKLVSPERQNTINYRFLLKQKSEVVYSIALSAILFFLAFAWSIQYLINKDKTYLYYAGYLFCYFVYFGSYYDVSHVEYACFWGDWLPFSTFSIKGSVLLGSYYFYFKFIRAFINETSGTSALSRLLNTGAKISLLFLVLDLFLYLIMLDNELYVIIRYALIGLMIPFSLFGLYHVFTTVKNALALIIIFGSCLFIVGSVVGFVLGLAGNSTYGSPNFYSQTGVLAETILFFSGMGYRTRLLQQEKESTLEKFKKLEIKTLKAQMSPHFISNCLGNIVETIRTGSKEVAISYAIDFSQLMHQAVRYALDSTIRLDTEIKICQSYINMENLRFPENKQVQFELIVQPEVDTTFTYIPPFFLQPLIENAIIHGLSHRKDGERLLRLHIYYEAKSLICAIEDNGVGRKFKAKKHIPKGRPSVAMSNIEKRIQLINELGNIYDGEVEIIFSDATKNAGTIAKLILPFQK